MRFSTGLLPLLLGTVAIAQDRDYRFGFTGTGGKAFAEKFGLRYYALEGNYAPALSPYSSSTHPDNDPEPGRSVFRGVAKLNERLDGLGEDEERFRSRLKDHVAALMTWYAVPVGPKPVLQWYEPDASALADTEAPLILETLQREKAGEPAVEGTIWEIGNEPNLFPAITPQEYAAIYTAYHHRIKNADPAAKVALGALFLPEAAQDLRVRLEEYLDHLLRVELEAQGMLEAAQASGIYTSLWQDLSRSLFGRILGMSGRDYLEAVLDALPPDVAPDYISLHVYPYDDRPPFQSREERRAQVEAALAGVAALLREKGIAAPLWVSEFGNLVPDYTEAQVALLARDLVSAFEASEGVMGWLYYKPTGRDESLLRFSGEDRAPLTRLSKEVAFAPADGGFTCDALNAVGLAYYGLSAGSACTDAPPPVADEGDSSQADTTAAGQGPDPEPGEEEDSGAGSDESASGEKPPEGNDTAGTGEGTAEGEETAQPEDSTGTEGDQEGKDTGDNPDEVASEGGEAEGDETAEEPGEPEDEEVVSIRRQGAAAGPPLCASCPEVRKGAHDLLGRTLDPHRQAAGVTVRRQ